MMKLNKSKKLLPKLMSFIVLNIFFVQIAFAGIYSNIKKGNKAYNEKDYEKQLIFMKKII